MWSLLYFRTWFYRTTLLGWALVSSDTQKKEKDKFALLRTSFKCNDPSSPPRKYNLKVPKIYGLKIVVVAFWLQKLFLT